MPGELKGQMWPVWFAPVLGLYPWAEPDGPGLQQEMCIVLCPELSGRFWVSRGQRKLAQLRQQRQGAGQLVLWSARSASSVSRPRADSSLAQAHAGPFWEAEPWTIFAF
ncbi:unnamed protein product [Rangifer tarandus platyrhynchus]|uniref:Uncharacterized protein n=1 Tax=Rangifer tarandus platyrhynchus TaxID=3082113 RepID=A0AC59Y4A2_RANTA